MKDWHPSQRGWFAGALFEKMKTNKNIVVITADLGFGLWDKIRDTYPDRFLNVGAAESAAVGIACGMALKGKIPIVYSITPFLLYRPFEFIRNYVNHEQIPVKLVGSGRDKDYESDGFTHDASDVGLLMNGFDNIETFYPRTKEQVPEIVEKMILKDKPTFISLQR